MKRIGACCIGPMLAVCAAGWLGFGSTGPVLGQEEGPTTQPGAVVPSSARITEPVNHANQDVTVSEHGIVDLHVQGADLRKVLQLLSTQSRTNIIATKEVQGTVTANLYGVTFAEALDAVLRSAGFGYLRQNNFIYVYTIEQLAKLKAAENQLSVKVFKLWYITAADAQTLVKPAMSTEGSVAVTPAAAVGIETSKEQTGGNAHGTEDVLVVKDYPENLEKITEILKEVDVRPAQVLIEATILRARLNEYNALGVDFTALAGVDFRNVGSSSVAPALTNLATGDLPAAELDIPNAAFHNTVMGGTGGINPGGLTFGFIYNQIAVFIRALEDVTDTAVVANPKLLVVNKQRGEVLVGRRDGYLTTTVSETTTTQTVEFLETGTKLVVRPYIMGDGYVRLEVHPEDSDGGVNAQGLPSTETTECTSNVLVKDGHTIVISGLFKESTSASRRQIPLLGNIPFAGDLFRRRVDETEREEVIILITPHILRQAPSEEASEELKNQVERFRIGMRQGLMWWGRDRMAQTHMRLARWHAAGGRDCFALWEVALALSMSPKHEEAIRLQERLTKKAIWASEPRYSSAAYIIERMMMQELGQPFEKVVPSARPLDNMELDEGVRKAFGIGPRYELPLRKQRGLKVRIPAPGEVSTQPASAGGQVSPDEFK